MSDSPQNFLSLSPRQMREVRALAADETDQLFVSPAQLAQVVLLLQAAGFQVQIQPPQVIREKNSYTWRGSFSIRKV
jgi:hypothetical protein